MIDVQIHCTCGDWLNAKVSDVLQADAIMRDWSKRHSRVGCKPCDGPPNRSFKIPPRIQAGISKAIRKARQ